MSEDAYQELIQQVLDRLKPGVTFRVVFSPGNRNNYTGHIRAVVDGEQIVYRIWSRHKRCWIYHVESPVHFIFLLRDGLLLEA